jgi:hypothetical protein
MRREGEAYVRRELDTLRWDGHVTRTCSCSRGWPYVDGRGARQVSQSVTQSLTSEQG